MTLKSLDEIREIRDKEGVQACLDSIASYDIKGILVCEGLHPDHYIWEAEGFNKEMKKRLPDELYLFEKFSHIANMFRILHRFGGMPNRHGTEVTKRYWEDTRDRFHHYEFGTLTPIIKSERNLK